MGLYYSYGHNLVWIDKQTLCFNMKGLIPLHTWEISCVWYDEFPTKLPVFAYPWGTKTTPNCISKRKIFLHSCLSPSTISINLTEALKIFMKFRLLINRHPNKKCDTQIARTTYDTIVYQNKKKNKSQKLIINKKQNKLTKKIFFTTKVIHSYGQNNKIFPKLNK